MPYKPANPPQVKDLLDRYISLNCLATEAEKYADKVTGGLITQAQEARKEAEDTVKPLLKDAAMKYGNYKDVNGNTVEIQRRIKVTYNPIILRELAPSWADACISEVVDAKAVQQHLGQDGIISQDLAPAKSEEVTHALILKIVQGGI